jgi:hypothetical protein
VWFQKPAALQTGRQNLILFYTDLAIGAKFNNGISIAAAIGPA